VLIIVGGSLDGLNLKGDLLALWMTLGMAVYLCIYRRYPDTPAADPAVLLSLLLVPIAWIAGDRNRVDQRVGNTAGACLGLFSVHRNSHSIYPDRRVCHFNRSNRRPVDRAQSCESGRVATEYLFHILVVLPVLSS